MLKQEKIRLRKQNAALKSKKKYSKNLLENNNNDDTEKTLKIFFSPQLDSPGNDKI